MDDAALAALDYLHAEGFPDARVFASGNGHLVALGGFWAGHTRISDNTPDDPLAFAKLQVEAYHAQISGAAGLLPVGADDRTAVAGASDGGAVTESLAGEDAEGELLSTAELSTEQESVDATRPIQDAEPGQVLALDDSPTSGTPSTVKSDEFESASDGGGVDPRDAQASYPGVAIIRETDDLSTIRSRVIDHITAIEEIKTEALANPTLWQDLSRAFVISNNVPGDLWPAGVKEQRDQFMALSGSEQAIHSHAIALRRSARDATRELLQSMLDTLSEGWPDQK